MAITRIMMGEQYLASVTQPLVWLLSREPAEWGIAIGVKFISNPSY